MFLFSNGNLLNPAVFNDTIRTLLKSHLGSAASQLSSHSLRAAIPSALAKKPELQNSADIKGWEDGIVIAAVGTLGSILKGRKRFLERFAIYSPPRLASHSR